MSLPDKFETVGERKRTVSILALQLNYRAIREISAARQQFCSRSAKVDRQISAESRKTAAQSV